MSIKEDVCKLQEIIDISDNIVFFGGAGVSTESGIPDFRSTDGLYSQHFAYPPETMLSHSFFKSHTEEFFDFYRAKMLCTGVKPNAAHYKLAELEAAGKLKAVVTQNIDGLHTAAGSKTVYELHGSVHRNYCVRCGKFFSVQTIIKSRSVPKCDCGGIIKPDVVLYEEQLNERCIRDAISAISTADVLIVAGTSLTVYPAAGFIDYFKGSELVLINRDATPYDDRASFVSRERIGDMLRNINVRKSSR